MERKLRELADRMNSKTLSNTIVRGSTRVKMPGIGLSTPVTRSRSLLRILPEDHPLKTFIKDNLPARFGETLSSSSVKDYCIFVNFMTTHCFKHQHQSRSPFMLLNKKGASIRCGSKKRPLCAGAQHHTPFNQLSEPLQNYINEQIATWAAEMCVFDDIDDFVWKKAGEGERGAAEIVKWKLGDSLVYSKEDANFFYFDEEDCFASEKERPRSTNVFTILSMRH